MHARADGFTSLTVVAGALGVMLGFPLGDPIVGLLISPMIAMLLIGTVRSVGGRLMDGIEPELVDRAEHALERVAEVQCIERVRLRWVCHRLHGDAVVQARLMTLTDADRLAAKAEASVQRYPPNVDEKVVGVTATVA